MGIGIGMRVTLVFKNNNHFKRKSQVPFFFFHTYRHLSLSLSLSEISVDQRMQDPGNELVPPPSSPTISSVSSSDLDTESTGSFFHDRSITLGTLMGVSFTFRASSRSHHHLSPAVSISRAAVSTTRRQNKKRTSPSSSAAAAERHRGRKWWRLCRDDEDGDGDDDGGGRRGGGGRPSSLGEFLEVERRFGGGAAELEGAVGGCREPAAEVSGGGRALFADGRVLPPAEEGGEETEVASALCRFPVSLTSICSGGGG